MSWEPEAWEGEVFEHLERCCGESTSTALRKAADEVEPAAAEALPAAVASHELAEGLRRLPALDDEVWGPRLA